MLIDNTDKLVEVIVDSFIWGDLHLNEKINSEMAKKEQKFLDDIADYVINRIKKDKHRKELLVDIFIGYFELKGSCQLLGVLKDRDQESKIKTLEKDNENFADMVKDLYVPTPDTKVGTF